MPTHDDLERALTRAFDQTQGSVEGDLLTRAVDQANRRRRRRDWAVGAGSGAVVLALVGGVVVGPRLLDAERVAGGPLVVAASASPSPPAESSSEPTLSSSAPATPQPSESPPSDTTNRPLAVPDAVLPVTSELGEGITNDGGRFLDGVGSAPLMGAQYCDAIDVANMPGGADVIKPLFGGLIGGYAVGGAANGDTTDVTVNVFETGSGAAAFDQILSDRGFCRWFGVTPTVLNRALPEGIVVMTLSSPDERRPFVGAIARAGDVLVGVTTRRADEEQAVAEAERLLSLTLERARAHMPQAKD
ncbi:MAG: hypothetical protein LCH66_11130 [Actinobacteria bacterium]|nr:hypothetical protein [Actinomycetota bacterium]